MDEKDLSILYRPQVDIERDYRSDGTIRHTLPDNIPEEKREPEVPEIPDDIERGIQQAYEAGEKILRIRKITEVMPPRAKQTVDDLLDTVMVWIGLTIEQLNKVKEEEPDEIHEIVTDPEPIPEEAATEPAQNEDETVAASEDDWPVMTSSGFVFDVIKNKDIWDIAHEQYLLDSAAIQEDFAEEYNNVMEGYVYQLVSTMDEIGLDEPEYLNYEYEGESVTGVPTNYQHLNDIIVRNQDIVNEYQDIFRKTHDLYTTDAILTAYDVASQARVRYLKEQYKSGTAGNYIEMYDKNYLADLRGEMESRYISARTNVYKLLHSAAQISKEMLAAQLELAISKCSLLSKEVNIFVKKEYESEGYSNTTEGTIKDISAGSGSETKQVTEPVKQEDTKPASGNTSTISLDDLMVGGGFGGFDKNNVKGVQEKVKAAADGAVKTANNQKKVTVVKENKEKKIEKKGQGV